MTISHPLTDLITFGEWAPDLPDFNQPSQVIQNVIARGNSYIPLPSLSEITSSLPKSCKGAFSFKSNDGNVRVYAGTEDNLFQLDSGTTWTNISQTSDGYNVGADESWSFVNYGDRVIASNISDEMQSFEVGSSTSFTDLSTSAPKARYIDVINNFVVALNTVDSADGAVQNRTRWSALDDPTDWNVSAATLSDFQDLQGNGGAGRGVVGSQNYAVIIQEKNTQLMEFVGFPAVFSFRVVEKNRGTKAPGSIVALGNVVYYLGEDGFYAFNGVESVPIGQNKVDDFVLKGLDLTNLNRVRAAADPINNLVMWSYPDESSSDGSPNRIIIYNPTVDRWTDGILSIDCLFSALSSGFTLEQLDGVSTSLDALGFSLDSGVWAGGNAFFGGFSSNNKMSSLGGANLAATLDTIETQVNQNGRATVTSVMPFTDSADTTCSVGERNLASDAVSFGADVSINPVTGECEQRSNSRFHRVRLKIPAGSTWDFAQGIKFRATPSGAK